MEFLDAVVCIGQLQITELSQSEDSNENASESSTNISAAQQTNVATKHGRGVVEIVSVGDEQSPTTKHKDKKGKRTKEKTEEEGEEEEQEGQENEENEEVGKEENAGREPVIYTKLPDGEIDLLDD